MGGEEADGACAADAMALSREIFELWRYRFQTPIRERAIVFYSEHESYYAYYEGIIAALKASTDLRFSYITSDPHDPILEASDSQIHTFYLDKLLPFFLALVNCRVFVMTLTDLGQFHLKRSINPVRYVYVFHAMNSIHMAYRRGAFDNYDSILCAGSHHVAEFRRESELREVSPRQLVEAGYPRLERIHRAWLAHAEESPKKSTAERTVLVAPSWGVGNVLEAHGVELLGRLLAAGFNVIARPHPETYKRSPALLAALEREFANHPRFSLERSVRTDDSLICADVLITDWSGIALEYAFGTERPVVYLDVPRKVHNSRYWELGIEPFEVAMRSEIGVVVSPKALSSIGEVVAQLIAERKPYGERIARLRAEYVFNFGHSSQLGARHILELAAIEEAERA